MSFFRDLLTSRFINSHEHSRKSNLDEPFGDILGYSLRIYWVYFYGNILVLLLVYICFCGIGGFVGFIYSLHPFYEKAIIFTPIQRQTIQKYSQKWNQPMHFLHHIQRTIEQY